MDADDNVMTAFSLPIWAKELSRQGVIAAAQKLRRENILQFDDADQDAIEKIVHRDRLSQHQHNNLQQRVASKAKLRVSTKAKEPRPRTRTEPVLVTAPATSGLPERCPSTYNSPSALGFRHCAIHFERARQLLHHPETEKWQEELNWLRGSVKTPEHLWILDTESCLFTYACPMAFEVCFRAYNGNANLRGPVDYDGASVDQLISRYRALCPPGYQLPKETESRIRTGFARIYPSGKAWGTTFETMRDMLIRKGFDPATHAVIPYTTTIDMQIFWKILSGTDQLFVASTVEEDFRLGKEKCCGECSEAKIMWSSSAKPVNAYHLALNMITNDSYSLKAVHRHLYGRESVELHRTDADTVEMLDVVRALVAL